MLNIVSKPSCGRESLFGLVFVEGLECMRAGRHGSHNRKQKAHKHKREAESKRWCVRHSQHQRQGLAITSAASKAATGHLCPISHCLEMPSAARGGKVKLAPNREEKVPDWKESKRL